jgi:hypothetical protein
MNQLCKHAIFILGLTLSLTGAIEAQQTSIYTTPQGNSVTDTRSLQNGQYTNDKTVTGPNGKTYTNDKTSSVNNNGHPVTTDTMTGPNGKSASSTTTYGRDGSKTTVTGPNGHRATGYRLRPVVGYGGLTGEGP